MIQLFGGSLGGGSGNMPGLASLLGGSGNVLNRVADPAGFYPDLNFDSDPNREKQFGFYPPQVRDIYYAKYYGGAGGGV